VYTGYGETTLQSAGLDKDGQLLFRSAMRRLAASVCVLTATREGVPLGMAVTAVTSLSMDPPSLLVCVNRSARLHPALLEGGAFCVNVLHQGQELVARQFGNAALSPTERFAVGDWAMHAPAGPRLSDAAACIDCVLEKRFEYGTHSICVGAVQHVVLGSPVEPLLYANGAYSTLLALAGITAP